MHMKTVTRTDSCQLDSSGRKNEVLRESCEVFSDVMEYTADVLPSFRKYQWDANDTQLYRVAVMETDFNEREVAGLNNLKSSVCREAAQKVAESFDSWHEMES